MLTEFDQNTIANMTAALDYVCRKIPAEKDSVALRKSIGDEIIRCARSGKRSVEELQQAGFGAINAPTKSKRSAWFGLGRLFSR